MVFSLVLSGGVGGLELMMFDGWSRNGGLRQCGANALALSQLTDLNILEFHTPFRSLQQLTKSPRDYRLLEASSRCHSHDVTRQHEHVSWCTVVTHTAARAAIIATLVPNVTIRSNRSTGPDCTACTASNKISQQSIRLCTPHMVIGPVCIYTRLASLPR